MQTGSAALTLNVNKHVSTMCVFLAINNLSIYLSIIITIIITIIISLHAIQRIYSINSAKIHCTVHNYN